MNFRSRPFVLIAAGAAIVVVAAVALVITLVRPTDGPRPDPVAATVPVALNAEGMPKDFSIGVVLTFGQSGEHGSEYNRAAQGAVVAAQRFAQGGVTVALSAENDRGSEEGARAAVKALAEQGASGVIVASTGPQARAAAKTAGELGLPAILPYAEPAEPTQTTWTTLPSRASIDAAVRTTLEGKNRVLLVSDGGQAPAAVKVSQTLKREEFEDLMGLAQEAAIRTGDQLRPPAEGSPEGAESTSVAEAADAVIVSAATPQRLARLVQALQARDVSVPLVLPDGAAAPAFTSTLSFSGARLLVTVVNELAAGTARAAEQHGEVTLAPKLTLEDAHIDWSAPAASVYNRVRGVTPEPGAFTIVNGARLKLLGLAPSYGAQPQAVGVIRDIDKHVLVGTGTEPLELITVQPAGKTAMKAIDWWRGVAATEVVAS